MTLVQRAMRPLMREPEFATGRGRNLFVFTGAVRSTTATGTPAITVQTPVQIDPVASKTTGSVTLVTPAGGSGVLGVYVDGEKFAEFTVATGDTQADIEITNPTIIYSNSTLDMRIDTFVGGLESFDVTISFDLRGA